MTLSAINLLFPTVHLYMHRFLALLKTNKTFYFSILKPSIINEP